MPSSRLESPHRKKVRWLLSVLLLVNLLVFGRAVTFGWVAWDDPIHVLHNPLVKNWFEAGWWNRFSTPRFGYPIPLPVAIYAVFWELWGEASAHAVHALSVLVHLVNLLLVFALGKRWSSSRWVGLVGATVWSLHPIVAEAVAWASDLNELLMACGVLLSAFGWERLIAIEDSTSGWWAVVSGASIAILSKPVAVVIGPFLLLRLGLDKAGGSDQRKLYLAAGLLTSLLAGWTVYHLFVWESHLQPVAQPLSDRGIWPLAPKAIGLYARNYIAPTNLHPTYYRYLLWSAPAMVTAGLSVLISVVAVFAVTVWKRSGLAVPLGLFVLAYLPYSNLIPLPRFAADTYMYLPTVGIAVVVGWAGVSLVRRVGWRGTGRRIAGGFFVLLVAVGTSLSAIQVERWGSSEKLLAPLLGNPDSYALPYGWLAYDKYREKDYARAAALLDAAWPRLRQIRALLRMSPMIYLKAGAPRRAAEARLRVASVHGKTDADWARGFRFLVHNDLPPPRSSRERALFERSLRAWRENRGSASRPDAYGYRFEHYLERHGLSDSPR